MKTVEQLHIFVETDTIVSGFLNKNRKIDKKFSVYLKNKYLVTC